MTAMNRIQSLSDPAHIYMLDLSFINLMISQVTIRFGQTITLMIV